MENPDTVFISETLAATAFYYGLMGGFVALGGAAVIRFVVGKIRGIFVWR